MKPLAFRIATLLSLLVTVFLAMPALSQEIPEVAQGLSPVADSIDSVDMATGRLHLHIPLLQDTSQRGNLNFNYSIVYGGTGGWNVVCNPTCTWQPSSGIPQGPTIAMEGGLGQPVYTWTTDPAYWVTEGGGAKHAFGILQTGGPFRSVDASGMLASIIDPSSGGWAVANKAGVQFVYPNSGNPYIQDSNGNQITTSFATSPCGSSDFASSMFMQNDCWDMTDTVNHTWSLGWESSDSACPYSTSGTSGVSMWVVPGLNGGTRTFKFCYSPVHVTVPYGGGYPYDATPNMLKAVVLPDGTYWSFDYNDGGGAGGPGDLIAVHLPTGGTISYTWSYFSIDYCVSNQYPPTITSRTVSDGTNSRTWTYSTNLGNSPSGVTVTDPDNNVTVSSTSCPSYQSGVVSGQFNIHVDTVAHYQGSATGGTWLATTTKNYGVWASPALPGHFLVLPEGEATTVPSLSGNLVSQVSQTYDSGFTSWDYYYANSWSTYTLPYGLVEDQYNYDWGNGAPGALLRTESIGHYAFSYPGYFSANLLALPAWNATFDPSGNKLAETDFGYDDPNAIVPSGVGTQHVSWPTPGVGGNLTSLGRWLNTSGTTLISYRHFYDTGLIQSVYDFKYPTPPSSGPAVTFAYTGAFPGPTTICNALNQCLQNSYDGGTGVVTSTKDLPNNQTTAFVYDGVLRPTQITYPDTGQENASYTPTTTTITEKISSTTNLVTTSLFDGLGRIKQTQLSAPEGVIYTDTTYDPVGRVYTVSNPHLGTSSATDGTTTFLYDALGRPCLTVPQNGTPVSGYSCPSSQPTGDVFTTYSGSCSTVSDEAGKARKSCTDGLGRTTGVWEDPAGSNFATTYVYDALGNLTWLSQSGSRSRTFVYDSLSRLTYASNPESGATNYGYDANGNLISKTDARNINTSYVYDALNRVTSKSYNDGTPSVLSTYDQTTNSWGVTYTNTIGRLTTQWTGTCTPSCTAIAIELFSYDPMGRVTVNAKCTPANCGTGSFNLSYAYNLLGEMTSSTNGFGKTFTYSYDSAARPSGVTSSWTDTTHPATLAAINSSTAYWPTGAIRIMTFGNGLAQASAYNNRLQQCRSNVNSSATYLAQCTDAIPNGNSEDFAVGFGVANANNGNVTSWVGAGMNVFNRSYTYDALNRLSSLSDSTSGNPCPGLSWNYDTWGNRTNQNVTSGSCGSSQLTFNTNNQITNPGFQYDAAGNLINDGSHSYAYDAENRIKTVDGGTTATYVYDGQGQRLRKTTGGVNTDYLYDTSGNVVTEVQGGSTFASGYVYLNGQVLAEYVNGNTYFAHHDHLGSARLVTTYSQTSSLNGLPCETQDQLPFGGSQALPNNYLLRGSEFDQSPWTNWDTGVPTITPNTTTAPDGSTTADKIFFPSGANSRRVQNFNPQVLGGAAGKTFTYTIWIRADAPLTLRILLEDRVSGNYQNTSTNASVTTSWQQFTVTRTIRSGIDGSWAEVGNLYNNTVNTTIYVWGAQVTNSTTASCDLTFRFTGYERDGETGNDYAMARHYASGMGRFLSPDPLGGDITAPQSLNRYAYVRNNPLANVDPSGMTCIGLDGNGISDLYFNEGDCEANGDIWDDGGIGISIYCDFSGVYGCDTGPGFGWEVGGGGGGGGTASPMGSQRFPDTSANQAAGIGIILYDQDKQSGQGGPKHWWDNVWILVGLGKSAPQSLPPGTGGGIKVTHPTLPGQKNPWPQGAPPGGQPLPPDPEGPANPEIWETLPMWKKIVFNTGKIISAIWEDSIHFDLPVIIEPNGGCVPGLNCSRPVINNLVQ